MSLTLNKKLVTFFFVSLVLALVVGFRGNTNDTQTYYNIFKNINSFNLTSYSDFYLESGVELGWGWYSKLISFFSDSSILLFTIFSFLNFYLIYKISNIVNIGYLSVLACYLPVSFFLLQQFMQIRQGFAVPAIILSGFLFLDKKYIQSIFFVFIGLMFHQITLAYIIIFFIYLCIIKYYPINSIVRFRLFNILLLLLGFFVARLIILPIAMSFFSRLVVYSDTEYGETIGLFSLANIKFYFEFILLICLSNKRIINHSFYIFMVYIFSIGLIIRIAFFDFAILSGRLSNVFLFIEVFLIPYFLYQRFSRKFTYFYLLIYFIFIFLVTWYFQAAQFLEVDYFLPLS